MNGRNIHITVEYSSYPKPLWMGDSPQDMEELSAGYVDLTGNTDKEGTDQVIKELMSHSDYADKGWEEACLIDKKSMIRRIIYVLDNKDIVLEGGLHFEGDGISIYPGCCCGTEQWVDIVTGLSERQSPWMGHDPDVSFRMEKGICYIANRRLNSHTIALHEEGRKKRKMIQPGAVKVEDALLDDRIKIIGYPKKEFDILLNKLERELREFAYGPLCQRVEELVPECGERFAAAFIRGMTDYQWKHWFYIGGNNHMERTEKERIVKELEDLRKLVSKEEFLELAAMFLQRNEEYLIMGAKCSKSGKTVYYKCNRTEYHYSLCLVAVTIEDLAREDLELDGINADFLEQEIQILSYGNAEDVYEILLWCYREGGSFFDKRYKRLSEQMKQKLKFLDEKPFTWWLHAGTVWEW